MVGRIIVVIGNISTFGVMQHPPEGNVSLISAFLAHIPAAFVLADTISKALFATESFASMFACACSIASDTSTTDFLMLTKCRAFAFATQTTLSLMNTQMRTMTIRTHAAFASMNAHRRAFTVHAMVAYPAMRAYARSIACFTLTALKHMLAYG